MSTRRTDLVLVAAIVGLTGCSSTQNVETTRHAPIRTVTPSLVLVSSDALIASPSDPIYSRNDGPTPQASAFSHRERSATVRIREQLRIINGRPSESSLQTIRTDDRSRWW